MHTAEGGERESEKKLVSYEESNRLAEKMLSRFQDEIYSDRHNQFSTYGTSIAPFLRGIPDTVLNRYGAHGITRGATDVDNLAAALNILENKSMRGWYGPLGQSGVFTSAEFMVISKSDQLLSIKKEGSREPMRDEIGLKVNIGALVVGPRFYLLVEELKNMFPDINIVKADELANYLQPRRQE